MKRFAIVFTLLTGALVGFAQTPTELVFQCSDHLQSVQDAYRAEHQVYADDTLLLVEALQAQDVRCFGEEVQYSEQAPLELQAFGDGLITADENGYSTHVWHRADDKLFLATENGVEEVDAPSGVVEETPEVDVVEEVIYHDPVDGEFEEPQPSEPVESTPEPVVEETVDEVDGDTPAPPVEEDPVEGEPAGTGVVNQTPVEVDESAAAALDELTEGVVTAEGVADRDPLEVVREADRLLEAGDLEAAQRVYLELIQEDYRNSFAHDGLARARFLAGNLAGAATTLQVAAGIDPENFKFHFNQGIALHLLGRHEEAVTAFSAAVNLGSEDEQLEAEALIGLALSQLHAEQTTAAVNTLERAVEVDPSPDRLYLSMVVRYQSGEDAELLPSVLEAAQETRDARFDLLAARIYRDLEDATASERHLQRAEERAESDEELAQVLMHQAAIALEAGDTPKVLLGQVRELDPSVWEASYNQGVIALQERQFELAVELLDEAFQHSRGEANVAAALARAYLNWGSYEEALVYAEHAVERDASVHAHITAAGAAFNLNDFELADEHLAGLDYTDQPTDVLALAGAVKYELRDYSGALAFFQAAFESLPSMDVRRNMVNALMATGQFQDAAVHLREMTRNNPNDGVLHQQLGWAEHMLGNTIDAQLAFRRATALGEPLPQQQ